jgi:pyruvate dehydrogenase E2 component (dihydrolipoamide acetyltransferase)
MPQRAEGQDTGHHHGPPKGAGAHVDGGDKVVASDEGGEITETDKPAPKAEREDSGTVVGAMQSSDAVRSEQAVAIGGVKAMPAVRALAKKLGVDLSRVAASGAGGVVTLADVKRAAEAGTAKVGAAPPRAQAATMSAASSTWIKFKYPSSMTSIGRPARTASIFGSRSGP